MTICGKCKKAADENKKHPKKCACPCQHKPSGSWNLRPTK